MSARHHSRSSATQEPSASCTNVGAHVATSQDHRLRAGAACCRPVNRGDRSSRPPSDALRDQSADLCTLDPDEVRRDREHPGAPGDLDHRLFAENSSFRLCAQQSRLSDQGVRRRQGSRCCSHPGHLYGPLNTHWSGPGNQVVANELARFLQDGGWLEPGG